MTSILAGLITVLAVGCLALSMPHHYSEVFTKDARPRTTMTLRVAGSTLLVAAAAPCVAVWGVAIGIVAWLGLAAAAVLGVASFLTFARSRAR
jgi:hypothetical protein